MIIKKELFPPVENNLPHDGWFQACVLCYSITANLILFEKHIIFDETIEYYAYLCSPCIKLIKKYPKIAEKYEKKCSKLIKSTYQESLDVEMEEESYEVSSPLSL